MVAISKRSLLLVCEENKKQTDRRFSETITKGSASKERESET